MKQGHYKLFYQNLFKSDPFINNFDLLYNKGVPLFIKK